MATRQIGKLKFNISKRGIAYKFGDGEIHRFAFQRPQAEEDEYEEQGYAYEQPYDENAYDGEDFEEEYIPSGFMGIFYRYNWAVLLALFLLPPFGIYLLWKKRQYETVPRIVLSAAALIWLVLALMLLFPGKGKNTDTKTNQGGNITLVSPNPSQAAPTPYPTTAPTPAPTPVPEPTPQGGAIGTTGTIGGTTTGGTTSGGTTSLEGSGATTQEEIVYFTPNGEHYHKQPVCGAMQDGTAGYLNYARNQGKTACPDCFGMGGTGGTTSGTTGPVTGTVFYATSGGTWFHKTATSCGMKNASPISRADAEARGQYACPDCLGVYSREGGTWYHRVPNCSSGLKNAEIVSLAVAKQRNQVECPHCMNGTSDTTIYWHTKAGEFYHLDKTCKGMKDAVQCTVAQAVKEGQTPCPKCIGNQKGVAYYCTDDGENYHTDKNCRGMKNAKQVTKAAAENKGKTPCPTCVGTPTTSITNKVFFTKDGTWYHIDKTCQGMKDAVSGTLEQAKKANKTACPECVGSTSAKVYGRKDGQHYHIVSDCSGMKGASQISVKTAQKAGLTPCPECIGGRSTSTGNTSTGTKVEVYCTDDGVHYHSYPTCSGMKNAIGTTVATAVKKGKTPCKECISPNGQLTTLANKPGYTSWGEKIEVYCTEKGTWYHANPTCTDMKNAKGTTIERAVKMGKDACPVCIGSTQSGSDQSVYATKYGTYYHLKDHCSGMSGAKAYTIATASAAGKPPCPVCIGASDTKVYITKAGAHYHVKSDCGGMKDPSFISLKDAVAMGKDYCPDCIGSGSAVAKKYGTVQKPAKDDNENTNAGEYDGFSVYYTENGVHFHSKRYCGDMSGATKNTLQSALNAGKTACPKCIDTSSVNTVYCRPDSRYYHTNSRCSGMTGATKLTLSIAVANGKTACPTCAGGELPKGSTEKVSSTDEKVYILLEGNYYHKSANTCGMKNGKATTKDRAVGIYGKSACPKCYDLGGGGSASTSQKPDVLTSVFWNPNGENYHLEPDCRGMKGAKEGTVAQARAAGKTACTRCFSTENSTRVFTTASDKYFHNKSVCGGEKKTIATTYTKAIQAGKKGCPSCTGKAKEDSGVYATLTSVYYHKTGTCDHEDLAGASLISLTKAKSYAKTACPKCY